MFTFSVFVEHWKILPFMWKVEHCVYFFNLYYENNFPFNPLHPKINMHILHTVLRTFSKVLTRRICQTIKSFLSWWSFLLFSSPSCVIHGWYCKENLDDGQSKGSKGQQICFYVAVCLLICRLEIMSKWGKNHLEA